MNLRRLLSQAALLLGVFLLSAGVQTFAAFSEPEVAPPGANSSAPLTTGISSEAKEGGLLLNTAGAPVGLIVLFGKVGIGVAEPTEALDVAGNVKGTGLCIGDDCRTAWDPTTVQGARTQVFTSSGTFTVPEGVTAVNVALIVGGGGGGGGAGAYGGGGGGGGQVKFWQQVSGLTAGEQIAVTVGAGGVGGAGGAAVASGCGSTGSAGGATSFGTYVTSNGGGGGGGACSGAGAGGASGDRATATKGGIGSYTSTTISTGFGTGGNGGSNIFGYGGSGGGAASAGEGGLGVGTGGGGGGSSKDNFASSFIHKPGGNGAAGIVVVSW